MFSRLTTLSFAIGLCVGIWMVSDWGMNATDFALMRKASASPRVWCAGYLRCVAAQSARLAGRRCVHSQSKFGRKQSDASHRFTAMVARIGTENDQSRTNRKE